MISASEFEIHEVSTVENGSGDGLNGLMVIMKER